MDTVETMGALSILPPFIAIGLALATRQVFLALAAGIWVGYLAIAGGNPLNATMATLDGFVTVLTGTGNARLVAFTLMIGALIALVQRAGGVQGFIDRVLELLARIGTKNADKGNRKIVELMAALTGLVIFIESNISVLTVGTLYRPLTDRLNIPREKLAYIADSTCAPSCILIPFNAWGAYIMGLLITAGIAMPFPLLIQSIAYNFYPILTIGLVFFVIFSGKDVLGMKAAEHRAEATGALLRAGAIPMMDDSVTMLAAKDGAPARALNMILPIGSMVLLMPAFLILTGWDGAEGFGMVKAKNALASGSGSASVLYSVSFAVLVAMLLYKAQGILRVREMADIALKGMTGMMSLALLVVLAFALNALCKEMGTGLYIASLASEFLMPGLIPAIVFVIAAIIAFSTGTSWGTFAIMIGVAVPLAQELSLNMPMVVAAALGGGVFGDHCSPTSDTTLIASMATANDHIDHVRTQLPYALLAGAGALILYLILGISGA